MPSWGTGSQPLEHVAEHTYPHRIDLTSKVSRFDCVGHQGVLQKAQAELGALVKKKGGLMHWSDGILQLYNRKCWSGMYSEMQPLSGKISSKMKIYIQISVWTEASAGHYSNGSSHLPERIEAKEVEMAMFTFWSNTK